jgi:hypothetical protein
MAIKATSVRVQTFIFFLGKRATHHCTKKKLGPLYKNKKTMKQKKYKETN